MTGFELQIIGFCSDGSTNCVTTTALMLKVFEHNCTRNGALKSYILQLEH